VNTILVLPFLGFWVGLVGEVESQRFRHTLQLAEVNDRGYILGYESSQHCIIEPAHQQTSCLVTEVQIYDQGSYLAMALQKRKYRWMGTEDVLVYQVKKVIIFFICNLVLAEFTTPTYKVVVVIVLSTVRGKKGSERHGC
jgi:uncharacterized protein Smg (DUF494 family)